MILGDKETFWMSWELIKVPYYFVPGYGGSIGYLHPNVSNSVCGGLGHSDDKGNPLWWNGHISMNKHFSKTNYINFTHYAEYKIERNFAQWIWETKETPFCSTQLLDDEIHKLESKQVKICKDMVNLYRQITDDLNE